MSQLIDVEEILAKMNKNQKINYDKVMQKMVKKWEEADTRPRILLHSCCAPCSTYTLEYLTKFADVTVYYANSNIHPRAEYQRRKYVQQKFIHDFNENTGNNVKFISALINHKNISKKFVDLKKKSKVVHVVVFVTIID